MRPKIIQRFSILQVRLLFSQRTYNGIMVFWSLIYLSKFPMRAIRILKELSLGLERKELN